MMHSSKTKRQMSYNSVPRSQCQVSNCVETPLLVGLGIILHQATRSKILINALYDMNMSISYNMLACIKQVVAEAVRKKVQDNSGVILFLPALHPSRMFSSELITQIYKLIHRVASNNYMAPRLPSFKKVKSKFNNIKWNSKEVQGCEVQPSLFCPEPKKEKVEYFSYTSNTSTLNVFRKHDIVWSMMKSQLDLEKLVPTWAAYNFLQTICKLPQNLVLYQLSTAVSVIRRIFTLHSRLSKTPTLFELHRSKALFH